MVTTAQVWDALGEIADPEIPVISLVELGVVRDVEVENGRVRVEFTPTFLGCPALEVMRDQMAAKVSPRSRSSPTTPGRRTGSRPRAVRSSARRASHRRPRVAPAHRSSSSSSAGRSAARTAARRRPSSRTSSARRRAARSVTARAADSRSSSSRRSRRYGGTPGSPVGPLLAGGVIAPCSTRLLARARPRVRRRPGRAFRGGKLGRGHLPSMAAPRPTTIRPLPFDPLRDRRRRNRGLRERAISR
jgi:Iron-sulfur cluster assembly protein